MYERMIPNPPPASTAAEGRPESASALTPEEQLKQLMDKIRNQTGQLPSPNPPTFGGLIAPKLGSDEFKNQIQYSQAASNNQPHQTATTLAPHQQQKLKKQQKFQPIERQQVAPSQNLAFSQNSANAEPARLPHAAKAIQPSLVLIWNAY